MRPLKDRDRHEGLALGEVDAKAEQNLLSSELLGYTRPGCEGCVRRSLGLIIEAFCMRCVEGRRRRQLYYAWWLLWGSTLTTATFAAAWLRGPIEPQVLPSLGTMALVALTHRWFDNHFRSAEA